MMRRLAAILLLFSALPAVGEDFSWPIVRGGCSGTTRGNDEESSETGFLGKGHNPDRDERKRLVVEWGKVSMGYLDVDGSLATPNSDRWIWKDDNSLRPERQISLRGRLLIESPDHKHRRPIDWVQGVRVIVSRLPEKKFDWSRRQEMGDAVWSDFVISSKGEFLARVSPGEVRRSVGKDLRFQVALSLGEKDGESITWSNTAGVLPQSVTMLSIPGPPAISKTMQIINGTPSYDQGNFNPAKLVRAVNYLMPMGKEKAIRELRAFLKVARGWPGETLRCDENIDTSDKTCVFLIVRLLFECADPKERLPDIATVSFTPILKEEDRKYWPLYPVYLQNDVPFFMVDGGNLGGQADQPERHIDWAEKHGRIRTKPLRPIDNPMAAAERLVALPQTERLYAHRIGVTFKSLLYRQAWNVLEDVNPRISRAGTTPRENCFDDSEWDARAKAASKLNIRWDEAAQRYSVK